MDLLMAGFQHNLLCHICSSSSHLPLFFLEAALLSCFASSLSSIALMHLVRLRVSKSQLSHFWIIEPSRFWVFLNFFFPCNPTSLFFPLEPPLFYPPVFFLCTFYDGRSLFTSFLCVLMIVARSSWHPGGRKESTRHSTRSLCSPGTCREAPGIHTPAMHGYQWLHLVFEI